MNMDVSIPARRILACTVLACLGLACARDWPPDTPEYKPSARSVIVEEPEIVVTADASEAAAPPPREKPVEKPKPAASKPAEAAAPPPPKAEEPEQKKEDAAATTLIGTWRVSGMSHNGQQMPMVGEMQMTLTFVDGGTVTMNMSHPQMPEPQSKQGSWSVSDDQITIAIENESKTGKYTFEGNNKVKLEFDEVTMELSRM